MWCFQPSDENAVWKVSVDREKTDSSDKTEERRAICERIPENYKE